MTTHRELMQEQYDAGYEAGVMEAQTEHDKELEEVKEESYDQGFDYGLNEGNEEKEAIHQDIIDDFTKFAIELHNYEDNTAIWYKFIDACTNASSIDDLPTSRNDLQ